MLELKLVDKTKNLEQINTEIQNIKLINYYDELSDYHKKILGIEGLGNNRMVFNTKDKNLIRKNDIDFDNKDTLDQRISNSKPFIKLTEPDVNKINTKREKHPNISKDITINNALSKSKYEIATELKSVSPDKDKNIMNILSNLNKTVIELQKKDEDKHLPFDTEDIKSEKKDIIDDLYKIPENLKNLYAEKLKKQYELLSNIDSLDVEIAEIDAEIAKIDTEIAKIDTEMNQSGGKQKKTKKQKNKKTKKQKNKKTKKQKNIDILDN